MARGFLLLLTLLLATGCFKFDLRPDHLVDRPATPQQYARGKALLQQAVNAHGGMARFSSARTAVVTLRDHWPVMLTHPFMPWDEEQKLMRFTVLLGQDDSRLEFVEGKHAGWAWGIQQWNTYTVAPGGKPVFAARDDIQFWLPTMQYFLELPFRLTQADVVVDAGTDVVNGVTYDRILVTWRTLLPQDDRDHYLVWLNRQTHLVDYVRYTVREIAPQIAGIMQYKDYRNVDGLMIPFDQTVVFAMSPGSTNTAHQVVLEDVKFGTDVPMEFLRPEPARKRAKP